MTLSDFLMERIFNYMRKKPDENTCVKAEDEVFILPNISWLHSWSLNETRDAFIESLFNNLPNEIILHIFRFFSTVDLCNVSLVCRFFKITADHDDLWKKKFNTPEKILTKSYKHMYMEWIHEKTLRHKKLLEILELQSNYTYRTACALVPSRHFRPSLTKKDEFQSIAGFNKHPNSSQDMIIKLSVDIDEIAPELFSLLEKVSPFQEKWQQPVILKQIIQRYYRFMQLKASNPTNILLIPTLDIEIIWQTHLLRPEIYRNDCLRLFNRLIDHSLIMKNIDQVFKEEAFFDTCQLYEKRFGEKYCSLPLITENQENNFHQTIYSYWDKTYFEFSSNLPHNYENPFSFTEGDFILDGKWFNLCKQFMSSTRNKLPIWNRLFHKSTEFNLESGTLKRLKKSYERFLYMAAKHPLKDGDGFVPPTYAIDIIWHSHMQEPSKYEADCLRLVGYVIYHDPWPIIENDEMKKSSNQNDEIWKKEFQRDIEIDHF